MSEKSVAQKLLIKPGKTVLVVNPPPDLPALLGALPDGATISSATQEAADIILAFIPDRVVLERQLDQLKGRLSPGGALWIAYYKGSSKHKTDIHRDSINAYAREHGLEGVAMISIDADWSALRLKLAGA